MKTFSLPIERPFLIRTQANAGKTKIMKPATLTLPAKFQHIGLKSAIDKLLVTYLPQAVANKTVMINRVEEDTQLIVEIDTFTQVLASVISIMSRYTNQSCISVSTKSFHSIVLIHFRDNSILNEPAAVVELQKLQPFAEKLGGSITVNIAPSQLATVTLSLLNKSIPQQ